MSNATSLVEAITGESATTESHVHDVKLRAFAWARVSTDMQDDRGLSMPQQLKEIREYAAKRGIELAGEFQEAASAFQNDSKRLQFHKMLERAKEDPEINAIVVHDLSRFSRRLDKGKAILQELRDNGIQVFSVKDPDIDPETDAGFMLEGFIFMNNEMFSRQISQHTRKGCRANCQTYDPETGWAYWNGGQPIWGYRIVKLDRGTDRSGKPILKSIVVPDETIVNGKAVHEWATHCLEEMAAKGASLDELRDFCNAQGIPAPRKRYWSTSTWSSLLQPYTLLKYSGIGVWNVHKKNGQKKPPQDWVIIPKAQKALISEDTALAILKHRKAMRNEHSYDSGYGMSRRSRYLLSGGLFKCGRCGANMIGYRTSKGVWYVCGSQPYRRGLGCGPGVYVPVDFIEGRIIEGIKALMDICESGSVSAVNRKLEKIWRKTVGHDADIPGRIAQIDLEIENIRDAIRKGLEDVSWANAQLKELKRERMVLESKSTSNSKPPTVDLSLVKEHKDNFEHVLRSGTPATRKKLIRQWVAKIELAPDDLEVRVQYKIPEPILNSHIAGGGFEPPTSGL